MWGQALGWGGDSLSPTAARGDDHGGDPFEESPWCEV